MRAGQQPGLEGLLAGERAAEVERADEPVERRAERQLDERRRARRGRRVGRRPRRRARARRARTRTVSPTAACTGGSSGASARTAVDFAVPRSPRTSTPPTSGATALTSSASTSASWPTIALSGIRARTRCTPPRLLELALEREVARRGCRRASLPRARLAPTCPRSAASSSRSAIAARRPRVRLRHERRDVVVEQVLRGDLLVHPVLGDAGRRVVAEQVVDGRRQLGRALVAVADHRRDPARVGDAGAEHPPRLLGERPRDDARGVASCRRGTPPGRVPVSARTVAIMPPWNW